MGPCAPLNGKHKPCELSAHSIHVQFPLASFVLLPGLPGLQCTEPAQSKLTYCQDWSAHPVPGLQRTCTLKYILKQHLTAPLMCR